MGADVIAAIATPQGRGGVGIVRISGPALKNLLATLATQAVEPRRATRATFTAADGSPIDDGLIIFFPAPNSYTGEDVIELHGHGGPIVLQSLLQRCLELGARVAEPGEFTKRAFLNDKLDLAQAESVADLIDASTTEAARCALRSLSGEFSQRISTLIAALIALRVRVEATLDFPEEDVRWEEQDARRRLDELRGQLREVVAASRRGSVLREGIHVVIAGEPNVGKSSLMNRLAGEERAIVTDIPGTTRDAIHATIAVRGLPVHLIDTAGLRESKDPVEKIGISKAWQEIREANLVLWLTDASAPIYHSPPSLPVPHLAVCNKIDLVSSTACWPPAAIQVSAKTGAGIDHLLTATLAAVGYSGEDEGIFLARERHLQALAIAEKHLAQATTVDTALELFAEELKLAQHALSAITGEYTADDLLGEIFSRFCIGK